MTNSRHELTSEDVKRIRRKLGWSQPELARRMDVSASAVRAWERENDPNPCRGPNAILLRLFERRPDLLSLLEPQLGGLPSPRAEEGSAEWFELQRLLGYLSHVEWRGANYWAALVARERLDRNWLESLESALLIEPVKERYSQLPDPRHPELRTTTQAARVRFHLDAWAQWIDDEHEQSEAFHVHDKWSTRPLPEVGVMDCETLALYTAS